MSTTYVSGPYTSGQLLRDVRSVEDAITQRFVERGPTTDATEQRAMADRLLDVSQGRNTVVFDDDGNPSVMVRVPSMLLSELEPGWPDIPHPAFVVNGALVPELYVAKYQAIVVGSGSSARALSLRGMDPQVSINWENSRIACEQKGDGWHLMTNATWAALALWTRANGYYPRGNNYYGVDHERRDERGSPAHMSDETRVGRVAAGTGPASWSHDGSPFGVFDLNGNVWEWVGGFRLDDGEIQIVPDNDAATGDADQSAGSSAWRALLQDGSLVAPGSSNTLKYNTTDGNHVSLTSDLEGDSISRQFDQVDARGVTIPDVLKQLGLFPVGSIGGDRLYLRTAAERLPRRGGAWTNASNAGVFALALDDSRSSASARYGFRPAWNPQSAL